ncbi:unnamed protein product [Scytosiphon promiscuus]
MALQADADACGIVWKIDQDVFSDDLSTDGELLLCKNWPLHTKSLGHNCCHSFSTVPVPLPQTYDEVRRIYYCRGLFCSWNCAKTYNLANTTVKETGDRNACISILAYRLWVNYKKSQPSCVLERYSRYNILPSPPKDCSRAFGGQVEIVDYRSRFFGIVPPDEATNGKPFLNIRETVEKETMVLPFVNLSPTSRPPGSGASTNATVRSNTHRSPFIDTTAACTGAVALHKNANEFCGRLNRATESEASMLKRKRSEFTKNTLTYDFYGDRGREKEEVKQC